MTVAIIEYRGASPASAVPELEKLRTSLSRRGLHSNFVPPDHAGTKGPGAALVVELAILGANAVTALVTTVAAWQATRTQYTAKMRQGDLEVEIRSTDPDQLLSIQASLSDASEKQLLVDIRDYAK